MGGCRKGCGCLVAIIGVVVVLAVVGFLAIF